MPYRQAATGALQAAGRQGAVPRLEVKPNGVKAWRYRFKLTRQGAAKESLFAIGDYATAPHGETPEEANPRRNGGRFTLAEAREERVKARALVKQRINPSYHRQLDRIRRGQEGATTFEAVAREWFALKDWESVTKLRQVQLRPRRHAARHHRETQH